MENKLAKVALATGGYMYLDEIAWQYYTGAGVSRTNGIITHTIYFEGKESEIDRDILE